MREKVIRIKVVEKSKAGKMREEEFLIKETAETDERYGCYPYKRPHSGLHQEWCGLH
nr:hypothetical protein [Archaeoglobus sulfaticallidus]